MMLSDMMFLEECEIGFSYLNREYIKTHLPKSIKLSRIVLAFLSLNTLFCIMSTLLLPGCMITANIRPIIAVMSEVRAKYKSVRIVILLLSLLFRLDEPTMRLEMISGKTNSLSSRMNSSPG